MNKCSEFFVQLTDILKEHQDVSDPEEKAKIIVQAVIDRTKKKTASTVIPSWDSSIFIGLLESTYIRIATIIEEDLNVPESKISILLKGPLEDFKEFAPAFAKDDEFSLRPSYWKNEIDEQRKKVDALKNNSRVGNSTERCVVFKCRQQNKDPNTFVYYQQVRSADEGESAFYECLHCDKKWTVK
jgi:DNA-directed RNA polymerase subunit M/transcription elongation factor TFIIS